MKCEIDYSLYLVTDRKSMLGDTLERAVEEAVRGGCTLVQLREKNISGREYFKRALRIKAVTDALGVPLIINDRVDIAIAVDAAGVHVGKEDIPACQVRRMIGEKKILGVSASTLNDALCAQREGADYVGVGAIFPTDTKTDAVAVELVELKKIKNMLAIPVIAIGGINKTTMPKLFGTGIDGVAVVSALLGREDTMEGAVILKKMMALCK